MKHGRSLAAILITLMGTAAWSLWTANGIPLRSSTERAVTWAGFLFGLPLILLGSLVMEQRWAFMGAVMYGTIGLALDLSTIVQELTQGGSQASVLVISGITGLLNFLLIAIGGRRFLDANPVTRSR